MSLAPDAPFGTWTSPIGPEQMLAGTTGLANPRLFGGDLFWMESRPAEGGRTTIMRRRPDGSVSECVPAPFNARSRVHEYGGVCYAVVGELLYFSNFADQRIHRVPLDGSAAPAPLTADDGRRFADFAIDAARRRLIVVGEEDREGMEPRNFLAAASLDDGTVTELASGRDFFSSPRLSPDGERLVWLEWDHPRMPWDGTELCLATLEGEGAIDTVETVAGGPDEAVFQPGWLRDGHLVFVTDRSGWWNLHLLEDGEVRCLHAREADFGLPMWVFGMRTWAPLDDGRIACLRHDPDRERLGLLDPKTGAIEDLDLPWTSFDGLAALPGGVAFVGAAPDRFPQLVHLALDAAPKVLRESSTLRLEPEDIAVPEAITFPTGADALAHAFLYRPAHASCRGAPGERPPLLVIGHGGPTAATAPVLNLKIQFWTSRGFAVLDVNYRGSTGYGRAFRDALKGGWGVVDVEDCVAAARYVAERGDVDARRMAIRGGSAGGLTVLNALIHHDVFHAGTSLYGVADLAALARDTHKFEARYLDSLVGPWPAAEAVYAERSPVNRADGLSCPVLFLQGTEDRIVPPSQPEAMIEVLDRKGIPWAYLTFEGEQHGFRQAPNIRRALEAELYFYGRVFGFAPADTVDAIEIHHLDPVAPPPKPIVDARRLGGRPTTTTLARRIAPPRRRRDPEDEEAPRRRSSGGYPGRNRRRRSWAPGTARGRTRRVVRQPRDLTRRIPRPRGRIGKRHD
ncbi:MAG: S9 family peptidase [Pseudomonadales bacterium]|jgi:dipeptidyl aminopeptidase/acylaminoacyl peptidase|nr:S9 family peptidase [Pseudomonadales bacterium]